MSTPNFRDALNDPNDDLNRFDAATGFDDLSAFDNAAGVAVLPAGWYAVTVVRGELLTTKKGKAAYRLTLDVADGPHAGFRLWRYFLLDTQASANRSKAALAPLGLLTSADLRRPFPGPNRAVVLRALVVVKPRPDGGDGNDTERFTVVEDRATVPNPNAVDPDAGAEGGVTC